MREIKFRAWHKPSKSMSSNFDIFAIYSGRDEAEAGGVPFDEDQIELMQFTGLKDKNGKEIYEGDIVVHFGNLMHGTTHIAWLDGGFTYANTPYDWDGMLYPEEWGVIGNIHENPELLK